MSQNFFTRLKEYYLNVAKVLRGEADAAAIFPNTTDIGFAREKIYSEFLKQHAPSKCNIFLGGFVFDDNGSESRQLDIIITTDTTPRFNLKSNGIEKSFSPIEGTLGIVSVKSTLNKKEIVDCLEGMASIPPTRSLRDRIHPSLKISGYEDWPVKIVYASDGISSNTLLTHIENFYAKNPQIPLCRRPNFIHVIGKYFIFRGKEGQNLSSLGSDPNIQNVEIGKYYAISNEQNSDIVAISNTLSALQINATASTHILFTYVEIMNKVNI